MDFTVILSYMSTVRKHISLFFRAIAESFRAFERALESKLPPFEGIVRLDNFALPAASGCVTQRTL